MPEEDDLNQDPPGEGEGGEPPESPAVSPEDQAILDKYGGDPAKVAAAYRGMQSEYTKTQTVSKAVRQQLEEAGYTIGDDGRIYAPEGPPEPPTTPPAGDDDDDWLDPRAKKEIERLNRERAEDREALNSVTQTLADQSKESFLGLVPEAAREQASKLFDAKVRGLAPAARANPGMLKLAQNATLGELVAAGAFKQGAAPPGTPSDVAGLSGSSEPPGGGSGGERRYPVTPDIAKAYNGLGGKGELGVTLEEYAKDVAQGRGEE